MEKSFEIKIDMNTMQIVSANSYFYRFSDSRRYLSFDKMITPSDYEVLKTYVSMKCVQENFILHLIDADEDEIIEMSSFISDIDENMIILHMKEAEYLFTTLNSMENLVRDYSVLLGQFYKFYYEYDKKTGWIEFFTFHPERRTDKTLSLLAWKKLISDNRGEKQELAMHILADIENGVRKFSHVINSKELMITNEVCETVFSGEAVYEKGIHIKTIGCVGPTGSERKYVTSHVDQLTGLLLKDDITQLAKRYVDDMKIGVSMAIVDIDDFKVVNDNYGHMKGDEVLRQCGSIISNAVKKNGKAGRIGGDEFLIVLDYFEDSNELRTILREIKNNIAALYSEKKDGFTVTTSIGCATYPRDTNDFNTLFFLADYLLYLAKNKGKNRYILYNPQKHGTVEELLSKGIEKLGVSSRKGMSKGEVICKIEDKMIRGINCPVKNILDDIVDYFGVERIIIYDQERKKVLHQCGNDLLSKEIEKNTIDYIVDDNLKKLYDNGVLVVDNVEKFKEVSPKIYNNLQKQGVLSFMHHEVTGKKNKKYIISYESVRLRNTWNNADMYYFRILDHIFSRCL